MGCAVEPLNAGNSMTRSVRLSGGAHAMTAALIDGKAAAAALRARVMAAVRGLADSHGIVPGLAVVLVGDDPASEVYIGAKKKTSAEIGIRSIDHRLPASASQ